MTSVISNAHRHGTRVVLTISVFAWTTGQANTQRAILGSRRRALQARQQAVAAVRDRGADGVNLDFEPLASGYADEFVAAAQDVPDRAEQGQQAATSSPTTRPATSATTRSRRRSGAGAADAIFIMGYDYRTSASGTRGLHRPAVAARRTTSPTRSAPTPPGSARRGSSWACRGTAAPGRRTATTPALEDAERRQVRLQHRRELRERRRPGRQVRPPVGRARAEPVRRVPARELHLDVRLRHQLAAGLLRRRARRSSSATRSSTTTACAAPGCGRSGYDGGHAELYRAVSESFLVDKSAPQAGIRMLADRQGDEGFVVSWAGARHQPRRRRTTSRSRSTAAPGPRGCTRTRATSEVWLGRRRPRLRVPRPRGRQQGQRGRAGTSGARWDASPSAGARRVRARRRPTASRTAAARTPRRPSWGRSTAGTIVAITRGPGLVRRVQLVRGHRADPRVVARLVRRARRLDRGQVVGDTRSSPTARPTAPRVDAGIRGLDFGAGPASGVGLGAGRAGHPAFSPNRDGSEDAAAPALDEHRRARLADAQRLPHERDAGRVALPCRTSAAGARTWDWNGVAGARRSGTAGTSCSSSARPGRATFRAPSIRPVTRVQVGAFARDRRHGRPEGHVGLRLEHA